MFKRLLGINKLEKNFKVVGDSLNRSWKWISHFNKANSATEDRIARLEKSNLHLIEVTKELISQLQTLQQPVQPMQQVIQETVQEIQPVMVQQKETSVNLPEKDLFLLQVVHQYAAFDKENAVDTNTIFNNLTYKITPRGLRKKLNSMVDNGLLRSVKSGNTRFWYLGAGTLAKVKKSLRATE